MPRKIDALARDMAHNHVRWGTDQIKSLVHAAQDGPGITRREEAKLKEVLNRYADRMEPQALSTFRGFLDTGIVAYRWHRGQATVRLGPWDPSSTGTTGGVAMDPTAATGPVFISPTGAVVSAQDDTAPATLNDRADSLYRLARLVDDIPGNVFAPARNERDKRLFSNLFKEAKVDLELKGKVLEQLTESIHLVEAGAPPPDGLTAAQALQMRSSATTVMLHLMESLGNDGRAGELKAEAFATFRAAILAEQNPILRESMIFNLYYAKDSFPAALQGQIETVYHEIAPVQPPYDSWFKDGNDTLRVSWRAGHGDNADDEFLERDTDSMVGNHGYEVTTDEPGHRVLEKTFDVRGKRTHVVIDARVNNNSMFENMDDPNTHIVGYSGHSNLGRNIRDSLDNARGMQGDKLLFVDLCSGKDGLFRMRDRYPDAHVVTTFDSSYYGFGEAEGAASFNAMIEGIAGRQDWETIDRSMKREIGYNHALDLNYLTPPHTLLRRRLLDRDHDGQADALDRLADFNLVRVDESTQREFEPVRSNHPADKLDGINVDTAVLSINTAVHYNDSIKDLGKTARLVADGYFVPHKGEEKQIVRFVQDHNDALDVEARSGDKLNTIRMQVNANFAHMSEEALRAVSAYEYAIYLAKTYPDKFLSGGGWPDGLDTAQKAKLSALVFASSDLVYNMNRTYFGGITGRDRQVWSNLLRSAGLPQIDASELFRFIDGIGMGEDHHHDYSGSPRVVKKFASMLSADQLAALKD